MHDHDTPDMDKDLLTQFGYEPQDVPVDQRLAKTAVFFFAFFLVSVVISWAFITIVDRTQTTRPNDAAMSRAHMVPSTMPLLQSDLTTKADIAKLRNDEAMSMEKVEWADKDAKVAKIPVEAAEEIVARRGLPEAPNAKDPEAKK